MKLKKYNFVFDYNLSRRTERTKNNDGYRSSEKDNFKILEGKRVGLITNPTGVDNSLKSTIDILFEAPNVNLVACTGPNTACAATCMPAIR